MRNPLVGLSILAVMAMLAVLWPRLVKTDQRPAAAATKPDLSGVWSPPGDNGGARPSMYFTREEPSMQPWAMERYKAARRGMGEERPDMGRPDQDPAQYPYCMPFGMPRAYAYSDGFEIVQMPGRVHVLFERTQIQRIYTDGRKHPEGMPLTFMGNSIGRWEGDTLVVETTNISDLSWIDSVGHPHSDALRVEQRFRRVAPDALEIEFLFDDPKAYTKPWGGKKTYKLMQDTGNNILMEFLLCEDHMREDFSRHVLGTKKADDPLDKLRKEILSY